MPKKNSKKQHSETLGSLVYENWSAYLRDRNSWGQEEEYLLYSDGHAIGEATSDLGPFAVFWTGAQEEIGKFEPIYALRIIYYPRASNLTGHSREEPERFVTDNSRYHGGNMADEMSALLSLCFGIRLKAGNTTRVKRIDDRHNEGKVYMPRGFRVPYLVLPKHGPVIPQVLRNRQEISEESVLKPLFNFWKLEPRQSVALAQAARLYQEAIWGADATPEQTWLQLVSAIEIVSNEWNRDSDNYVENMQTAYPRLAEKVSSAGGEILLRDVAEIIGKNLGATKKFRDFLLEHLPPPPPQRPGEWQRIDWTPDNLKKSFNKIYTYRSEALHAGKPFPKPMCKTPQLHKESGAYAEKVEYIYERSNEATWNSSDLPMLLHVFEYIVRGSIINWWLKELDLRE